jgi:myosin heavy subunit
VQLPRAPGQGQPKTFAAALLALAESRKYAAQLEATAKAQKSAEQKLLAEVAAQRDELAQAKSSLVTAQDKLVATEQQLAQAKSSTTDEVNELREQITNLESKLTQADDAAAKQLPAIEELTRDRDELRNRLDKADQTLAQRDKDIIHHSRQVEAAERANAEVQIVADLESRRLRAEKELRIAAEQQVKQLLVYLEQLAADGQPTMSADGLADLHGKRADLLAAELRAVRLHSDEIDAEREHLAARILKLMAPGKYLEHAIAAGYEVLDDPLVRLKREEIRVEHRYYMWQVAHGTAKRARKIDPEQTLDEQAYAGAIALRWRRIDRPLRNTEPQWFVLGNILEPKHEQQLMKETQVRIKSMLKKMGAA